MEKREGLREKTVIRTTFNLNPRGKNLLVIKQVVWGQKVGQRRRRSGKKQFVAALVGISGPQLGSDKGV